MVWSVQTREVVGRVKLETWKCMDPLPGDCSRIWVRSEDLSIKGWDFGVLGSPPTPISNIPSDRPHLNFIYVTRLRTSPCQIKNTITGKEISKLVGKYAEPKIVK